MAINGRRFLFVIDGPPFPLNAKNGRHVWQVWSALTLVAQMEVSVELFICVLNIQNKVHQNVFLSNIAIVARKLQCEPAARL
jgi:hypothetical protein